MTLMILSTVFILDSNVRHYRKMNRIDRMFHHPGNSNLRFKIKLENNFTIISTQFDEYQNIFMKLSIFIDSIENFCFEIVKLQSMIHFKLSKRGKRIQNQQDIDSPRRIKYGFLDRNLSTKYFITTTISRHRKFHRMTRLNSTAHMTNIGF